jgi:flagellar basal body-associated protein FliL
MAQGRAKWWVAIAVVLVAGVAAGLGLRKTHDEDDPAGDDEIANEATGSVPEVVFDSFTTELRGSDADDEHHVRLSFSVEGTSLAARDAIEASRAGIRDAAIELLADRTPESLRGAENLEQLKTALQTAIEGVVPGETTAIKAVYLQEIIVQ